MTTILRFGSPYSDYVEDFYRQRPGLASQPSAVQREALHRDFFPGASDSMTHALRRHGYETFNYCLNVEPAQKAWAREHGVRYSEDSWPWDIARAQVLASSAAVLLVDPYGLPAGWLQELRRDAPDLRLVVSRYSSPKQDLSRFADADLVLSADPDQVAELARIGVQAAHLHHAFDTRVWDELEEGQRRETVVFPGQLLRAKGFHLYRIEVVHALLDSGVATDLRVPAAVEGPAASAYARRIAWNITTALMRAEPLRPLVRHLPVLRRVAHWVQQPTLPVPRRIAREMGPPLYGIEMLKFLASALVGLNVHGDVTPTNAANLRLFEVPGVGTCLLTDAKVNLKRLFDIDREIVTFDNAQDCVEKAAWLLSNPAYARQVGEKGRERVRRDHSYERRAEELDVLLRACL